MSSTNVWVGNGNVTRDLQLRYVGESKTPLVNFGIALNERYGDKESTTYVDIEFWGKKAEVLAEYVKKGDKIGITGGLRQDSWDKDGKTHYKTFIKGTDFEFLTHSKKKQVEEEAPF